MASVTDPTQLAAILRQYGGVQADASEPQAAAPARGQIVRMKGGTHVQVAQVHGDGTFDGQAVAQTPTAKVTKVDPSAMYMGPEKGPFRCGHCVSFRTPHGCVKVSGSIDPSACCNLYQPK